jgi:hypothetical protein
MQKAFDESPYVTPGLGIFWVVELLGGILKTV